MIFFRLFFISVIIITFNITLKHSIIGFLGCLIFKFLYTKYKNQKIIKSTKRNRLSILVTGCSSGIGKILIPVLSKREFHVFATVRKSSDVEKLKKEYSHQIKQNLLSILILDITKIETIKSVISRIQKSQKPLYGLINNAGIHCKGPIEIALNENIKQCFEVNFFGLLKLTQMCIPLLRDCSTKNEIKQARIIHISSMAGLISLKYSSIYGSSKWALQCLSYSLDKELKKFNIRSLTIKCCFY